MVINVIFPHKLVKMGLKLILSFGIIKILICLAHGNGINPLDIDYLQRQQLMLELVQHIHQNDLMPNSRELANSYCFEENYHNYNNQEVVKNYVKLIKIGLYPKSEIFNIINIPNRNEAIALFQVFCSARNWNTFYNAARWARFNVNDGIFMYALNVAMVHREELNDLKLPAPYEVFPEYFFTSDVLQDVRSKILEGIDGLKPVGDTVTMTVRANYTRYV